MIARNSLGAVATEIDRNLPIADNCVQSARTFPIETHTRVPLLHIVFSKRRFDKCLRHLGKDWATGSYMNLLSLLRLRECLRGAGIGNYEIHKIRFIGLTVSFVVTW